MFGFGGSATDPPETTAWLWAFSSSRILASASCNCWAICSGEGDSEGGAGGTACGFTCGAKAGKIDGELIRSASCSDPKFGLDI